MHRHVTMIPRSILCLGWLVLTPGITATNAQNGSESPDQILLNILEREEYNSKIPPNFNEDLPAEVSVQLVVLSIDSVDESAMDYSLTLFLRQTWMDERLQFESFHYTHHSDPGHVHGGRRQNKAPAPLTEASGASSGGAHGAHGAGGAGGAGSGNHDDGDAGHDESTGHDEGAGNHDGAAGHDGDGDDHGNKNGSAITPHKPQNHLELDFRIMDKVWYPDTYFSNERTATFHKTTVPNVLMHIFSNGTVFYSMRLSMTLTCHMDLASYPFDRQQCPLTIGSYGFTTRTVRYRWSKHGAVRLLGGVELPTFQIDGWDTMDCAERSEAGSFSCIHLQMRLSRSYGYYVAQVYVPSILIVSLSWVNFWLDVDATPARISLGLLTVLTMTTMGVGARSNLPRVSYLKSIDLWMVVCLIFVYAALLEFAYVNVTTRVEKRRMSMKEVVNLATADAAEKGTRASGRGVTASKRQRARMVDKISRLIFPSGFVCFNIFYWCYYML